MSPPVDLRDIRFVRNVERLHRLGPRVIHALLTELGAQHLLRQPIKTAVSRYVERLTPKMLEVVTSAWWPDGGR